MEFRRLSYSIHKNVPSYGNRKSFNVFREITKNNIRTCSESSANFETLHLGTHIDFPLHFIEGGKTYGDYDADFFVVRNYKVLEFETVGRISTNSASLVTDVECECVFIVTGDYLRRGTDQYSCENYGLTLASVEKVVESYPSLRFLCVDSISVSRVGDSNEGAQIHQYLLSRDILIIEDYNPAELVLEFDLILILPLPILEVDGAPTVIQAIKL